MDSRHDPVGSGDVTDFVHRPWVIHVAKTLTQFPIWMAVRDKHNGCSPKPPASFGEGHSNVDTIGGDTDEVVTADVVKIAIHQSFPCRGNGGWRIGQRRADGFVARHHRDLCTGREKHIGNRNRFERAAIVVHNSGAFDHCAATKTEHIP